MNDLQRLIAVPFLLLASVVPAHAASPPALLNYQGVLRDAQGAPLNGSYDVVFRFFDAAAAGNEILVDRHQAVSGGRVTVTGGLFATTLGGGAVEDGSGPGTYATLAEVFRDHEGVWFQVEVSGETLAPRVRVLATGYSLNAARLEGRAANQFLDVSSTAQAKDGRLIIVSSDPSSYGLTSTAPGGGGYFADSDASGYAALGWNDQGLRAWGNQGGGFFGDLNDSARCYAGFGNNGVEGYGTNAGGYFKDSDGSGRANVGIGDRGIEGYGDLSGGYFEDLNGSGWAIAGSGDTGLVGNGSSSGGYFNLIGASAYSQVASFHEGQAYGIRSLGSSVGGYFADLNSSGEVYLGHGTNGVEAYGSNYGGYFENTGNLAVAFLGFQQNGIYAYGHSAGATFFDLDTSTSAAVGTGTYKIQGTGTVSFVQNHPEREDRVIVYHAPEASEVAVYTRGSGRLIDGAARLDLDPTFRWVANPDIGLTAHLTARGRGAGLYVANLSTESLEVRCDGPGCATVAFDYIVYGLRIGFEELAPIQEKVTESLIPSMRDHRQRYEAHPDLRGYNALERFKDMIPEADRADLDLSRAGRLVQAIGEYDPEVHGPVDRLFGLPAGPSGGSRPVGSDEPDLAADGPGPQTAVPPDTGARPVDPGIPAAPALATTVLPASGEIESGDLLVLDPERPASLRRASSMADPGVVGVALTATEATASGDSVAFAALGMARLHADAGYGAIRPGDLLCASPTPGHAMRAAEPLPGTIVGKSLEALDTGTGDILVLIAPR